MDPQPKLLDSLSLYHFRKQVSYRLKTSPTQHPEKLNSQGQVNSLLDFVALRRE